MRTERARGLELLLVFLVVVLVLLGSFTWRWRKDAMQYFGVQTRAPSTVRNSSVTVLPDSIGCDNMKIAQKIIKMGGRNTSHSSSTLPLFEASAVKNDNQDRVSYLSQKWMVLPDKSCLDTEHLKSNHSNVCVKESYGDSVTCFPSFTIIGFEKCSTTQLLLWLSYHPNLLGRWKETRYFSTVTSENFLNRNWRDYLKEQVPVPGGFKNVGNYWNFDKTPSSILNRTVADWVHAITPNIRMLIMIRNPAKRALSAFVMYTRHINNFNEFAATWNVKKVMYSTLIIRNLQNGQVKFAKSGGIGGAIVKKHQLKSLDKGTGPWKYIGYPPSPQDFHDFLLTNCNITAKYGDFYFDSRQSRVVQEGYYARYINKWLEVFPKEQFLIIPMESLWNNRTLQNMGILQQKLGIPQFNYKKVTYFDKETKRYELKSASTFFLWSLFNMGNNVVEMLPESKSLLDAIYCKSNRELQQMIPSAELKGYSCT